MCVCVVRNVHRRRKATAPLLPHYVNMLNGPNIKNIYIFKKNQKKTMNDCTHNLKRKRKFDFFFISKLFDFICRDYIVTNTHGTRYYGISGNENVECGPVGNRMSQNAAVLVFQVV